MNIRWAITGAALFLCVPAAGAGTLITLSSATFNGAGTSAQAHGVAIDSDNIILTGCITQNGVSSVLTVKYDPELTKVLSSATLSPGGDAQGNAVTTDSQGNVIVAGQCPGSGTDILIVKYSPDFTSVIASMVYTSSGTNTDAANGVAVDPDDNIVIAGSVSDGVTTDGMTLLFDSDLTGLVSAAAFKSAGNGASAARAVAVDVSSNIFVAGQIHNGTNTDWLIVKYDPNLQFLSSATYNGSGDGDDSAAGLFLDDAGNVWVTGESFDTVIRSRTMKYNPGLTQVLASIAGPDFTRGRALDQEMDGSILVAGKTDNYTGSSGFVVRYSSDLAGVVSSASFNGMPGGSSEACGIVVGSSGSFIVAGYTERSGNNFACTAWRCNGPPVVAYVSPEEVTLGEVTDLEIDAENLYPGAAVTLSGTGITMSSFTVESSTTARAYVTVAWDAPLGPRDVSIMNIDGARDTLSNAFTVAKGSPVVSYVSPETVDQGSSADLQIEGDNFWPGATPIFSGTGIAISSYAVVSSSIICTYVIVDAAAPAGPRDVSVRNADGGMDTMAGAVTVVNPPPVLYYVSPEAAEVGQNVDLWIEGDNFDPGAKVTLSGTGVTVSSYAVVCSSAATAYITIGASAEAGPRDVSVQNPDGGTGTMAGGFNVQTGFTVDTASAAVVYRWVGGCGVRLEFLAGTFDDVVTLFISSSAPALVDEITFRPSRICLDVANDLALQPLQPFTLTLSYADADISGLDESKLIVARYDEPHRAWAAFPSSVYPDQNKIVVHCNHFSRFAVLQLVPAATISAVRAFPNPFAPGRGLLVFDNLTAEATIKIFTVAGEQVRNVPYGDGSGRAYWDGKNDGGNDVASGVYLVLIKNVEGIRRLKVAVER